MILRPFPRAGDICSDAEGGPMRLYRSSGSFVQPGAVASTVLRRANPSSVEMGGVHTSFFAGGLPLSPSAAAVDWEPAFSGRYGFPS